MGSPTVPDSRSGAAFGLPPGTASRCYRAAEIVRRRDARGPGNPQISARSTGRAGAAGMSPCRAFTVGTKAVTWHASSPANVTNAADGPIMPTFPCGSMAGFVRSAARCAMRNQRPGGEGSQGLARKAIEANSQDGRPHPQAQGRHLPGSAPGRGGQTLVTKSTQGFTPNGSSVITGGLSGVLPGACRCCRNYPKLIFG